MKKTKLAAIGNSSVGVMFHAAGIHTKQAENYAEAKAALEALLQDNYWIIFLSETIAALLQEELRMYAAQPFPILLPLPMNGEDSEIEIDRIRAQMERAIGVNILDSIQSGR